MVDFGTAILGFCLVIASSINLLTVFRIVKQSRPESSLKTQAVPRGKDESTVTAPQEEISSDRQPTTKSEILAWRRKIIREIEQERGSRVITMIHKRELWTGPGEQPEIGLEDAETVLQQIRIVPSDKPIDLILHTPGGIEIAAEMMAMALKFHPEKVTVFVPYCGALRRILDESRRRRDQNGKIQHAGPRGPADPNSRREHMASRIFGIPGEVEAALEGLR